MDLRVAALDATMGYAVITPLMSLAVARSLVTHT